MARGNFGERLKRERELREVTLAEITSATRIGPRFLEALENEDWEKLPGGVFNRGFVRAIARYLGLNEEALLGEYDVAYGTPVPPAEVRPEPDDSLSPPRWKPGWTIAGALLLFLVIILGAIFMWNHFVARRKVQPPPAASSFFFPQPGPFCKRLAIGHPGS
jgi:cytoskeletal protein RodZ